ncbi:mitotic spindle assembly checkpoint protein MAD1 isoform X2 [Pteropus medius]|uniref:mitotic spindle assembly checkpoint protein MAD1 isoform X2 n=1 Tax=Pteropus vampyrus TaxID=132908 RepID=UPI00196B5152|nr:mitotic spindle assembly checkpoint protein MAD1 isoform X2 [Pteropus giganteus]
MEDLGENTTVLSSLRSLNNFISQRVEGGIGLDVSTSAQGSLQMQYQQSMQLEERAEQIRSKSHVIQVEREKMQMELSHKRARVELERAASTSARSYEREVDRNQELLARIRQLQEREAEAEEKMKEQLEHSRLCKQSLDVASRKLREKEDGLAEAGETISELKGRISELQWSVMSQEMQVKDLESEKQELQEQLGLQRRKWQEANQKIQELQASQEARADQEQKVKDLEQKLSLQEQDAVIVRSMKSELVRLPKVEQELKQLREENAYLREMRETNGLLREEVEGLQRKLGRQEKMQENLVDLELEKERLLAKLQSWERLDQTTGLSISARELDKVRQQLQEEVRQVSAQLLEERKKRETHEALARRLQKRVLLLTKERDGMRAILGSYDSELTPAEYSPQLTRRMREAEDLVQKVHAHSSEMEAQLSQALEELGVQKQRADMLEMELRMLQCQAGPAEQSVLLSREEVSSLRLKIEELEGERCRLEEDKQQLETQLQQLSLVSVAENPQLCGRPDFGQAIDFILTPIRGRLRPGQNQSAAHDGEPGQRGPAAPPPGPRPAVGRVRAAAEAGGRPGARRPGPRRTAGLGAAVVRGGGRAEEAGGERGAEKPAAQGGFPDQDPGVPEGLLHAHGLPGGHHQGGPVPADVHVRRAQGRLPRLQALWPCILTAACQMAIWPVAEEPRVERPTLSKPRPPSTPESRKEGGLGLGTVGCHHAAAGDGLLTLGARARPAAPAGPRQHPCLPQRPDPRPLQPPDRGLARGPPVAPPSAAVPALPTRCPERQQHQEGMGTRGPLCQPRLSPTLELRPRAPTPSILESCLARTWGPCSVGPFPAAPPGAPPQAAQPWPC